MTLNVSVSEIRNNISRYLEKASKGTRILIRDNKRNVAIAQLTQIFSFDKEMYEKVLQKAAGVLSIEHHPEWGTKTQITKWLTKSRLRSDRSL